MSNIAGHSGYERDALYPVNALEPVPFAVRAYSPPDLVAGKAMRMALLSSKRGDGIGRFGLGFKPVLAVSDSPQFLSTSGSFHFDRE